MLEYGISIRSYNMSFDGYTLLLIYPQFTSTQSISLFGPQNKQPRVHHRPLEINLHASEIRCLVFKIVC